MQRDHPSITSNAGCIRWEASETFHHDASQFETELAGGGLHTASSDDDAHSQHGHVAGGEENACVYTNRN